MMCFIYLHIEVKIRGAWHHYQAPELPVDLGLFSKMAGVPDGRESAISQPKGMPKDVTFLTEFAHQSRKPTFSESWLSAEEVAQLCRWLENNDALEENELFGALFGSPFGEFLRFRDNYPAELEDFRFVFWFEI